MTERRCKQTIAVAGKSLRHIIGSLSDDTGHGTDGVAVTADRHRVSDSALEVVAVEVGDDGLRRATHTRHIVGVVWAYPVDGAVKIVAEGRLNIFTELFF